MKQDPHFKTEVDLCAAFIAAVPKLWVPYAETAGWDILLVNKSSGRQIGVQAKLKMNANVIAQAIEGAWPDDRGPDFRAILVPATARNALCNVAAYCAVTVIGMQEPAPKHVMRPDFSPGLPRDDDPSVLGFSPDWFEMLPVKRCDVPEFVPDVAAGSSAPVQLTKWKIAAIKLGVLLDQTGYLTRNDFKVHRVDIRRWISGTGWLIAGPNGFVAGPRFPAFREQHPRVWDEVVADPKKWRRAEPLMVIAA